jgi:anti-sigma factor RsiW
VARLEQVERAVRFRVRVPATLPEGFRFIGAGVVRYGPVAAAQLRYVYGAAPVSLFQVPARRVADDRGPQGEIVAFDGISTRSFELGFLRVLTWEADGLRLTVVGSPSRRALLALAVQTVRR